MKRQYLVDVVNHIVKNKQTAEIVIDRLIEEGALHVGYGNADVDKILLSFSNTFGTTKASKYDRFSATRLASKYGVQAILGIIGLLGQNSQEKYAPVVNNVSELESKMPSVLNFLRNIEGSKELNI